jgi:putative N6-adenine-specific DNA methylase
LTGFIKQFYRPKPTSMPLCDLTPSHAKRVKRQIIGKSRPYFVVTPPGLENLCAEELRVLVPGIEDLRSAPGGVGFVGKLPDCYQANLQLRTASRVLMCIDEFKAPGMRALTRHLAAIAWELFLFGGPIPRLHVSCRHSKLYHSRAVAERVAASLEARQASLPAGQPGSEPQRLFVRLQDDRLTLSIDSSGELLHKRGIKTHHAPAPLRETLAAAILTLADYAPSEPLIDPMCGAGTFSLEAAMRVKNVAAGQFRPFAFMGWPAFQPARWAYLKRQAATGIKILKEPLIFASDRSQQACQALSACLERHALSDAVRVAQKDVFDLRPRQLTDQPGLLVINPPYGLRLGTEKQSRDLIRHLLKKLRADFAGWRLALVAPPWADLSALPAAKFHRLWHGGLQLALAVAKII